MKHYIAKDVTINIDTLSKTKAREAIIKKLHLKEDKVKNFNFIRSSLDTRKASSSGIFYVYTVEFDYSEKPPQCISEAVITKSKTPVITLKNNKTKEIRPIIVGAGPAGLFCALRLSKWGIKSIIIDRGSDIEKRVTDVNLFWKDGIFNKNSNVSYGLGGSGAMSDGKLTTRIKNPYKDYVLEEFVNFGANNSIKYFAKPHLGTDNLRKIVAKIRDHLILKGCEFRFDSFVTDLIIKDHSVAGVILEDGEELLSNSVFLGCGNAARETYKMLFDRNVEIASKPFALGVRIEHFQDELDHFTYKSHYGNPVLSASEYSLTYNDPETKRGVYSFCNCPGGYVIASSSEENTIATNGMSFSKRNGKNSNSAIVVSVSEKDYDTKNPLAGVEFQRELERKAFTLAGGTYYAPVMNTCDFLGVKQKGSPTPTYRPGVKEIDLNDLFDGEISKALKNGLKDFSRKINGFENSILTAPETKTSSPVRIQRDENTMQSVSVNGLYPIGEGSGYSGGIVSSAADGAKAADILGKIIY